MEYKYLSPDDAARVVVEMIREAEVEHFRAKVEVEVTGDPAARGRMEFLEIKLSRLDMMITPETSEEEGSYSPDSGAASSSGPATEETVALEEADVPLFPKTKGKK